MPKTSPLVSTDWLREMISWDDVLSFDEREEPRVVHEYICLVADILHRRCPFDAEPGAFDRMVAQTLAAAMWRCRRLAQNGLTVDQDRQKHRLESDRRREVLADAVERKAAMAAERDAVQPFLDLAAMAGGTATGAELPQVIPFKPRRAAG